MDDVIEIRIHIEGETGGHAPAGRHREPPDHAQPPSRDSGRMCIGCGARVSDGEELTCGH